MKSREEAVTSQLRTLTDAEMLYGRLCRGISHRAAISIIVCIDAVRRRMHTHPAIRRGLRHIFLPNVTGDVPTDYVEEINIE